MRKILCQLMIRAIKKIKLCKKRKMARYYFRSEKSSLKRYHLSRDQKEGSETWKSREQLSVRRIANVKAKHKDRCTTGVLSKEPREMG